MKNGDSASAGLSATASRSATDADVLIKRELLEQLQPCVYGLERVKLQQEVKAILAAPAQPAAQDQGEVLTEHSGCGRGIQVDQLTVRMYPGDKVVRVRGRIGKALAASTGQEGE